MLVKCTCRSCQRVGDHFLFFFLHTFSVTHLTKKLNLPEFEPRLTWQMKGLKIFKMGWRKVRHEILQGFLWSLSSKNQKKIFLIEWRLDLKSKNKNMIFHPRLLNGIQLIEWSDTDMCEFVESINRRERLLRFIHTGNHAFRLLSGPLATRQAHAHRRPLQLVAVVAGESYSVALQVPGSHLFSIVRRWERPAGHHCIPQHKQTTR